MDQNHKLDVSAAAEPLPDSIRPDGSPARLSHRIWNRLTGLCMIPFVVIFTMALFKTFVSKGGHAGRSAFWVTADFKAFAFGAGVWIAWSLACIAFWKYPRPMRAYVLGHELMHMLMARVSFGKVRALHWGKDGGYIVTNKYNFLISLAPYLWPFYAVPVLAVWGTSLKWDPSAQYRGVFLFLLGLTWMFHLTFTLWVLRHGQSDLRGPGRIFSMTLIYLANAFLFGWTLVLLAPDVSAKDYLGHLWSSTREFYERAAEVIQKLAALIAEARNRAR